MTESPGIQSIRHEISQEITGQVFGIEPQRKRSHLLVAVLIAIALHLTIVVWAILLHPTLADWGTETVSHVRAYLQELERKKVRVKLPPLPSRRPTEPRPFEQPLPQPLRPVPVAQRPQPRISPRKTRFARRRVKRVGQKPSQAQAGRVLTQKPDPQAPLDFSGGGFVSGSGTHYAGGVTSARGDSKRAVQDLPDESQQRPLRPRPRRQKKPSYKVGVRLAQSDWNCPWPTLADRENIDEQTVLIRVQVSAKGHVEQVNVLQDPGFGFAQEAKRCAFQARFLAAQDDQGRPVRAFSPPIRVHFSR